MLVKQEKQETQETHAPQAPQVPPVLLETQERKDSKLRVTLPRLQESALSVEAGRTKQRQKGENSYLVNLAALGYALVSLISYTHTQISVSQIFTHQKVQPTNV